MAEQPEGSRTASRQTSSSNSFTTLTPLYEQRRIIVAQGIEFTNTDLDPAWTIPVGLAQRLTNEGFGSDIERQTATELVFVNHNQQVRYSVRVVTQKDEYKTALETEGVHVVYGGHARYGRGACFGATPAHGENWGRGTNTSTTGIFPMGYPYIGIPSDEIEEHQYTAFPVPTTVTSLPSADRHPSIRGVSFRRIRVADLPAGVVPHIGGVSASDQVWGYGSSRNPTLVLHAGWENTGQPFDLGSINMQCRVYCHFGCKTYKHNYRVVRFLKNWRRDRVADTHYAYWTIGDSYGLTPWVWIYHIMTYSRLNAFQSWDPHIVYAVTKSNRELARNRSNWDVDSYQII